MTYQPLLRIGAVSRATGVAVSTLRSWERRYGLPIPARTAGGHRLYARVAVSQVRDVQALVAAGAATSAAAAAVLGGAGRSRPTVSQPASQQSAPLQASLNRVPLADLLKRTRAAKAENHRLRSNLSAATAAASASLDRLRDAVARGVPLS